MKKVYIIHHNKRNKQNKLDQSIYWKNIQHNKYYKTYYKKNNIGNDIFIIKPNKKHKILEKALKNLMEDILEEDISIKRSVIPGRSKI